MSIKDGCIQKNKKLKFENYHGFTLVELIVVISILAILSIIAFVSVRGFQTNARDGVRISDIKSIHQGLAIFKIKAGTNPLPDDYVSSMDGSGTITQQGYAGDNVVRAAKINIVPLDPVDKSRYIYVTSNDQKKSQLMGYLESEDNLNT